MFIKHDINANQAITYRGQARTKKYLNNELSEAIS